MNFINEVCNSFNKYAITYEKKAKVQLEIGCRLFDRLSLLKTRPQYILDLGCGSGFFSKKLAKTYSDSKIIGIDLAKQMLMQAQKQVSAQNLYLYCASMQNLPFPDQTFDIVFANQVIHWTEDYLALFKEIYRVLKPNGCFMFSTLGSDTFIELKNAWFLTDTYAHSNDFFDMHDVGDTLIYSNFKDIVMDMEKLRVEYQSLPELLHSLKLQGVRNMHQNRKKGLTTAATFKKLADNFRKLYSEECCPLTYEIIYGHAWKLQIKDSVTETFFPASAIKIHGS